MGGISQLSAQHTKSQIASVTGNAGPEPSQNIGYDPVASATNFVRSDWGQLQGILSEFSLPSFESSSIPPSVSGPLGGSLPSPPQSADPLAFVAGYGNRIKTALGL